VPKQYTIFVKCNRRRSVLKLVDLFLFLVFVLISSSLRR